MRAAYVLILFVLGLGLYAFGQNPATSASPASAAIAAPTTTPVASATPALVGVVVAIVAGLNVLLSSVQTIFSALSKSEPGWLTSVSGFILSIAKFLGSNPNV